MEKEIKTQNKETKQNKTFEYEFYKKGNRYQITGISLPAAKNKLKELFLKAEGAELLTVDGCKPEYYKSYYKKEYK